jgi:hypothetical protein
MPMMAEVLAGAGGVVGAAVGAAVASGSGVSPGGAGVGSAEGAGPQPCSRAIAAGVDTPSPTAALRKSLRLIRPRLSASVKTPSFSESILSSLSYIHSSDLYNDRRDPTHIVAPPLKGGTL